MNDIISSFNEVWIKKLYHGDLLNVDIYSLLFTSSYFNEVYNNLCGNEITVNEQFGVSIDCFVELLTLYILYRNKGLDKSFKEVIKKRYYTDSWNSWPYYTYNNVVNMIPLLERIYENLNFDKVDNLNLGKAKVVDYSKLIINIGLIEPISNEFPDRNDMEDKVTTNIVREYFIKDVDQALTGNRERQIIYERFGLNDSDPQLLETVGQRYGTTRKRVRQIEAKVLKKIRRNSNVCKYEGKTYEKNR